MIQCVLYVVQHVLSAVQHPPFKGYRSVTQGEPFSHTIFNVVMYVIICHWEMVVAATKAGAEGIGGSIQYLVA